MELDNSEPYRKKLDLLINNEIGKKSIIFNFVSFVKPNFDTGSFQYYFLSLLFTMIYYIQRQKGDIISFFFSTTTRNSVIYVRRKLSTTTYSVCISISYVLKKNFGKWLFFEFF